MSRSRHNGDDSICARSPRRGCMYSCKLRVRAAGAIEPRVAGGVSGLSDLDLTVGVNGGKPGQGPLAERASLPLFFRPPSPSRYTATARRREVFSSRIEMPVFLSTCFRSRRRQSVPRRLRRDGRIRVRGHRPWVRFAGASPFRFQTATATIARRGNAISKVQPQSDEKNGSKNLKNEPFLKGINGTYAFTDRGGVQVLSPVHRHDGYTFGRLMETANHFVSREQYMTVTYPRMALQAAAKKRLQYFFKSSRTLPVNIL
jgi:hypothetical protein